MAVTDSEKDYSCSTCGHFEVGNNQCRSKSPAEQNPQMTPGTEEFTLIDVGDELFRWCGEWKRMGSLNNPS